MGVIAAGVGIGTAAAVAGPLAGQLTKEDGPDYNAMSVNQSATLSAGALMQRYHSFTSRQQLMPTLYSYAGYSQPQIQSIMDAERSSLLSELDTEYRRINGTAWGSEAHHQLKAATEALGGYGSAGPQIGPGAPNLTGKFDEQFTFNPNKEEDPGFVEQRRLGLGAIDKQTAAKGLTNSGYGAVLNSQFLNQLGAQSYATNYNRQLGEYNLRNVQNQQGQAYDQNTFGRLLSTANLSQNNNQFGAQLQQNSLNTGAQLSSNALQATGQQTNQNNAMNSQMYQQMFGGVSNAVTGGMGSYLNQQNANQWMDVYRNMPGMTAGRQFSGTPNAGGGLS